MFGLGKKNRQIEAQPEPQQWITIGDRVSVDSKFGERTGEVKIIAESPYWAEAQEGIIRVFIVGEGWTDWRLVDEITLISIEGNTAA